MIFTVALDNGDGTAKIDGLLDKDDAASWEPTPGYAYAEGEAYDKASYLRKVGDLWVIFDKLTFNQSPDAHNVTVGDMVEIHLGAIDVEVFLDGDSQGIDADGVIEITPGTIGAFRLDFVKFPYLKKTVYIYAT